MPHDLYIFTLFGNQILKVLSLYALREPFNLRSLVTGLDVVEEAAEGRVGQILSPLFPKPGFIFLRSDSPTPGNVGAALHHEGKDIVFLFRIHEGMIEAPELTDEFRRSIRIEAI